MSALPSALSTQMTEAEWQARCDLAALYRISDHFGWTDIIATHMDLFYVAGAPPPGAKTAAAAVLKAIRSSHE